MEFKSVVLFGGAMVVELPTTFADVSTIREVPDHQEVYLDTQGYTNVIVEILERVDAGKAPTDEDAIRYHLNDIVSTETDETRFWGGETIKLAKMPNTPAYTLFTTQHVDRNPPGRQSKEDFTGTLLTLARLPEQKTDILLVVNIPHIPGEYDKDAIDLENHEVGKLIEDGKTIRDRIVESFKVKDYALFVNEE